MSYNYCYTTIPVSINYKAARDMLEMYIILRQFRGKVGVSGLERQEIGRARAITDRRI